APPCGWLGAEAGAKARSTFSLPAWYYIPILSGYRYNKMNQYSRILLISNSTVHGRGYLDHVQEQIKMFLGDARKALFSPLPYMIGTITRRRRNRALRRW